MCVLYQYRDDYYTEKPTWSCWIACESELENYETLDESIIKYNILCQFVSFSLADIFFYELLELFKNWKRKESLGIPASLLTLKYALRMYSENACV